MYYDTLRSTADFDKSYDNIYAVFARNAPETDRQDFAKTLPYVKCDARCLADRKAVQTKNDEASARRGEEWRAGVGEMLFGGRSSSSSNSVSSPSKSTGVAAIRSETYDNAGRKTEGYWVKCSGGSETRVYRTAWDSNRSWYRPGGGNGYFVADGGISINDVAQRICK